MCEVYKYQTAKCFSLIPFSTLELEDPLESDVTDYEVDSEEEVEVLSSNEDWPEVSSSIKRASQQDSIQVVQEIPAPVQYNSSKYFKKKKVYEHVAITGGQKI